MKGNLRAMSDEGYTEVDPDDFPPGYVEALIEKYGPIMSTVSDDWTIEPSAEAAERYNKLAEEYGKDCPNPDCICKKGK